MSRRLVGPRGGPFGGGALSESFRSSRYLVVGGRG